MSTRLPPTTNSTSGWVKRSRGGIAVEGEAPGGGEKELEERETHHEDGHRELDGRHHARLAAERVAEERRDVRQEPEQHGADDRRRRRAQHDRPVGLPTDQ